MGHAVDDINGDQLDIPGGTYDQAPFTHPDVVEREYSKLEPYLNIFSQRSGEDSGLALKVKFAKTLDRYFDENPGKEEKFQEFLKGL